MSDKAKERLLKYGICGLFTALMVWAFFGLRDAPDTTAEWMRMLCDAFTLPGVILLCVGGLVWASQEGALDGLGYVVSFAVKSLIPGKRSTIEKYADYVARRREKARGGFGFLLISGGIVMALAMIFFALFYLTYQG